jgi:antitoxin component YwqK of YwqJK toxin-antitoxin module
MKTAFTSCKFNCCIFFFQLFAFSAFAQTAEITKIFVDYEEKPSTSKFANYYIETYKTSGTDAYWVRKMYYADTTEGTVASVGKSRDAKGQVKEGAFVYYHKNGTKESEGGFVNNLKEGEWRSWNKAGNLSSIEHFKEGKMVGKNISWHDNKRVGDSTILDDKGNGKSFTFYEDGAKSGEGGYTAGQKNGPWTYYYDEVKNQKSIEVIYEKDSAINYTCYNEEGELQKKGCVFEREAVFKGGDEGWRKYLVKKLTAESDNYSRYLKQNESYTVIVRFIVSKDGSIQDVRVEAKGKAKLDAIAVDIIQNSPDWIPAVQYNRKVNAYRRQPITFMGAE